LYLQRDALEVDDINDEGVAAVQARPRQYLYSEHSEQFDALRHAAGLEAWDMRKTKLSALPLSWQDNGVVAR
jgi:hypothetical protein